MRMPLMVTLPPKRVGIELAGSPPLALSLAAKKGAISLPATIFDFLAMAMFAAFELGMADTDMSGLSQLPEFGALLCELPAWSPCMWLTRRMSILPSRGSAAPATCVPGRRGTRPVRILEHQRPSCGQNCRRCRRAASLPVWARQERSRRRYMRLRLRSRSSGS
jgi:hypothetical protein